MWFLLISLAIPTSQHFGNVFVSCSITDWKGGDDGLMGGGVNKAALKGGEVDLSFQRERGNKRAKSKGLVLTDDGVRLTKVLRILCISLLSFLSCCLLMLALTEVTNGVSKQSI